MIQFSKGVAHVACNTCGRQHIMDVPAPDRSITQIQREKLAVAVRRDGWEANKEGTQHYCLIHRKELAAS